MLQELVKFFINPVLQIFLVIMIFIFQKRPGKFFTGFVLYFYFVSIPLTGIVFHHLWKLDDSFKKDEVVWITEITNEYVFVERDLLTH